MDKFSYLTQQLEELTEDLFFTQKEKLLEVHQSGKPYVYLIEQMKPEESFYLHLQLTDNTIIGKKVQDETYSAIRKIVDATNVHFFVHIKCNYRNENRGIE